MALQVFTNSSGLHCSYPADVDAPWRNLSSQVFGPDNPLINVPPSTLDFCTNCRGLWDAVPAIPGGIPLNSLPNNTLFRIFDFLRQIYPVELYPGLVDVEAYENVLQAANSRQGLLYAMKVGLSACEDYYNDILSIEMLSFDNCTAVNETYFFYNSPGGTIPGSTIGAELRPLLPASVQNAPDLSIGFFYALKILDVPNATLAFSNNLTKAVTRCSPQICPLEGFTGNPDMSGIGMVVAFGIEIVLTWLIFFFAMLHAIHDHFDKTHPQAWIGNKLHPLDLVYVKYDPDLLDKFCETVMFFGVSLATAATIYIWLTESSYEYEIAYLAISCSWPAFVIGKTLQSKGKVVPWYLPLLCVAFLIPIAVSSPFNTARAFQDSLCVGHATKGRIKFAQALGIWSLSLPILVWILTVLLNVLNWDKLRKGLLVFFYALGCATIVVAFGFIVDVRLVASNYDGPTFTDNDWGFGQILAMFIWAPIALLVWQDCQEWLNDKLKDVLTGTFLKYFY